MKFTLPIHAAVGVWFARSVRILSIDGTLAEEYHHQKHPQTTFNNVSGRIRSWASDGETLWLSYYFNCATRLYRLGGHVMPRIYLNAFWVALMILTNLGSIEICEAQNKKDKLANEKTTGVLIQKEKGPSGHSTIGIVESTIERDTGETLALTFSRLMTWEYDANNDRPPPEKVEELDGRKVKLTGFMYPLQQGDSIQYFCLLRTTQTCCYGPRPQFNQYVFVEMVAPTEFYRLDPVACVGKFRVEPTPDEGYIYRIEGQKCESFAGMGRE